MDDEGNTDRFSFSYATNDDGNISKEKRTTLTNKSGL